MKTTSAPAARSRSVSSPRAVRRPKSAEAKSAVITRILDGAQDVIIRHGYAGFTTRRVAQAAGMRPGNLAYHFPRKRQLLRALIARILEEYTQEIGAALTRQDIPPGRELPNLVQYMLTDSVAPSTVWLAREFWAMSLHDEFIRREVEDFYDVIMERAVQMLRRSRPRAKVTAIRELVHILTMLTAGSGILHGLRRDRYVSFARVTELVTSLIAAADVDR